MGGGRGIEGRIILVGLYYILRIDLWFSHLNDLAFAGFAMLDGRLSSTKASRLGVK